jgi:predicted MPP superfamily phosphohydrolase
MGSLLTSVPLANRWGAWRNRYLGRGQSANADDLPVDEYTLDPAYGFRGSLGITTQRIWLSDLPEGFRSFRILQLTDIHHSLFVPLSQVAAVVELSNRLKPDLIALTGDFVTYSRSSIEPVAEMLGALRARAGVVAVLGNHDFRVGADAVEKALRRHHIQVLRNRHRLLHQHGDKLYLAGVDDYGYGADLERAMRGIPEDAATILLAHNPRLLRAAACRGIGLMLSGHTHGGQVNLPLLGTVYGRSPEQMRFKKGWDRLGATQIYVSRGIGTIVLPLRWRCPAEVPLLELEPHRREEGRLPGRYVQRDHAFRSNVSALNIAAD